MAKIAYWLLNKCTTWDQGAIQNALAGGDILGDGKNTVMAGQRQGCDPGVLMYEQGDQDEYFIPIPVKCLGDFTNLGLSPENLKKFQPTLDYYSDYFTKKDSDFFWTNYWGPGSQDPGLFPDLKMVSPKGEGYYRSLQLFNQKFGNDFRHIIIGYSQGGLVARYLAWMDENLFDPENQIIEGIVTVESPNFGSPLAHSYNQTNVMQNALLVIAGVAQFNPFNGKHNQSAALLKNLAVSFNQGGNQVDMDWVLTFLDTLLGELGNSRQRYALRQQNNQDNPYATLETIRKWLSGLDQRKTNPFLGPQGSAFYDLDISKLTVDGTVLKNVNDTPLHRIQHAAIVGSDNSIGQFAVSVLEEALGITGIAKILGDVVENLFKQFLAISNQAYQGVMVEQFPAGTAIDPAIQVKMNEYLSGVSSNDSNYLFRLGGLDKNAHDFVIPSAYQLILKQNDVFLGNWVNPNSNHVSGGLLDQQGSVNQGYLIQILKEMKF